MVQDNGPSYEPDPDPDTSGVLNAVSCAPGTDFCMFVDDSGGGLTVKLVIAPTGGTPVTLKIKLKVRR